jgi:predicted transcriptional regulator
MGYYTCGIPLTSLHAGLIEENDDRSLTTTAKGRLFLREYSAVERLLQGDEKGKLIEI